MSQEMRALDSIKKGFDRIAGSNLEQPKAGPEGEAQDVRSNPSLSLRHLNF